MGPERLFVNLANGTVRADKSPLPRGRGRTQGRRRALLWVVLYGAERRGNVTPLGEGSRADQEPRPLDIAGVDRQTCEGGRNGDGGGTHGCHRGESLLGNDSVSVNVQVGEQ
jgi:hypothetical protein